MSDVRRLWLGGLGAPEEQRILAAGLGDGPQTCWEDYLVLLEAERPL